VLRGSTAPSSPSTSSPYGKRLFQRGGPAAVGVAPPPPPPPPDLLQLVAEAIRKLRTLGEQAWRDNPTLALQSEQLHDVMTLYVGEVSFARDTGLRVCVQYWSEKG
jgi:hypothetical protein